MDKLLIVMPAYNEEKRIGKTLDAYSNYFKDCNVDICVVINNTTDNTESIVKTFVKDNKNITYINTKDSGKGLAVIIGFVKGIIERYSIIGFVDSDMATSPEAFCELILALPGYDGVIASRYMKKSVVNPKQSFKRIIASRIFNMLIKVLFFMNYKDTQCGAKIFRREVLIKVVSKIKLKKWAFDVDLLYRLKKVNARIREYPTVWSDKEYSKLNFWKVGPRMGWEVIKLRFGLV